MCKFCGKKGKKDSIRRHIYAMSKDPSDKNGHTPNSPGRPRIKDTELVHKMRQKDAKRPARKKGPPKKKFVAFRQCEPSDKISAIPWKPDMSWNEAELWVTSKYFASECFYKGWDPMWVYRYIVWKLGSPAFRNEREGAVTLLDWKPPGPVGVQKDTLELIIRENRDLYGDNWEEHEARIT